MVKAISIIFMSISLVLSIVLPIVLAIVLNRKLHLVGVALAKNIYLAELCIGTSAIASLFWIFKSRSYIEAT